MAKQGQMSVLGKEGDTKVIWDSDQQAEVDAARAQFDALKKKGYAAFNVKKDGEKGSVMKEFDPDAEKIIMALPVVGG
jgi:hypothetical protein